MRITVMGKGSVPGQVKTRLEPHLGPKKCALLNSAMMHDTLTRLQSLKKEAEIVLSVSGVPSRDDMPAGTVLERQQGSDLGARMMREIARGFAAGHGAVILIGTDHPTLPLPFVEEAMHALSTPESLVLGPSVDGGYYLIGMSAFYPELFRNMTWSTDSVFAETTARAAQLETDLTILPPWYDVDTAEDLDRLLEELREGDMDCPRLLAVLF